MCCFWCWRRILLRGFDYPLLEIFPRGVPPPLNTLPWRKRGELFFSSLLLLKKPHCRCRSVQPAIRHFLGNPQPGKFLAKVAHAVAPTIFKLAVRFAGVREFEG